MRNYYKIDDKIIDLNDISVLDLRTSSVGTINPVIILKNGYKLDFDRYQINSDGYNSFVEIKDMLLDEDNMSDSVNISGKISVDNTGSVEITKPRQNTYSI